MMRVRFVPLALLLVLSVGGAAAQDDGMTNEEKLQLYQQIRSCTVKVLAMFDDTKGSIGTGVGLQRFGDHVVIVTNAHVIGKQDASESQDIKVRPWTKGKEVWLHADILCVSQIDEQYMDIAFLVVRDPDRLISIASPVEERSYEIGQTVYSCGHPRGEEFLVDHGKILTVKDADWLIGHDAMVEHGNSGGGLFDTKGRLLGINTWMVEGKYGLAQEIHAFLGWWKFYYTRPKADVGDWQDGGVELKDGQFGRILAVGKWQFDREHEGCNALGRDWNADGRIDNDYYFGSLLVRSGDKTIQVRNQWKKGEGQKALYPDYGVQEVDTPGRLEFRINDKDTDDNSGALDVFVLLIGYPKGYLGAEVKGLTGEERSDLGLKEGQGARVVKVDLFSPAAEGGMEIDDVIVAVDGVDVDAENLSEVVLKAWDSPYKTFVTVLRDGKKVELMLNRHH